MEDPLRIRPARWTDKDLVAALIADALYPSPLAAWLVPDPDQRRQVLTGVVGIWVEHAMFFGDIHLTDDNAAATVGFHRYRPIPPPANYRIRLTDAAGDHADRFDLLDSLLSTKQPTEPHYHLAFLAVRPDAQKAGHGTALLAHHRSRLNRIDLPAWTTVPSGCERLYVRYGYTPRPPITLPDGPTLNPMRRNSRRGSAMPINPTHPVDNRWQDLHP
ncbi:GNAT family N-acetyltransferase [Micromonospora sp. DR5-3]|uniref:GNAT family N-acetyltransferase n=1 Tax=unclassified Micromonospora TaxID=2617518 RepID=UPI0011DAC92B|nr:MULTISPECIES: GNAT family N-acetyltransferase [unclassified Micromonospora]MCW3818641.1 GNAT family N-acetyltransferase [Micromonospora sp. DR5-3]TYC19771.1 GNAT family N-acetyltransferase [Micromonospora sp. MP36]